MSYCVNCGVKLVDSEPRCPLCDTPVINPVAIRKDVDKRPYPEVLETPTYGNINRRYAAKLGSVVALFLMLVLVFCDVITDVRMTWSVYVVGAYLYIDCLMIPIFYRFKLPYIPLGIDALGTALYLLLIARSTGGLNWFIYLGLPLTALTSLFIIAAVWIFKRKSKSGLRKFTAFLILCAAALTGIESLLDHYIDGALSLQWSLYSMIPLVSLGAVLLIISFMPKIIGEIKKRLFV